MESKQSDWKLVFSTSKVYQAEILKSVLWSEGIVSFIVNKKDSSYLFGEAELYVKPDDVIKSSKIIKEADIE